MKKREIDNKNFIVAILAVVLFTALVVIISNSIPNSNGVTGWASKGGTTITYACSDIDGGVNEYYKSLAITLVKSTGKIRNTAQDYCISESSLNEAFCKKSVAAFKTIDCEFGCMDGACLDPFGESVPFDMRLGDLNFDGNVDFIDSENLYSHILGDNWKLTENQKVVVDLDFNGEVNRDDYELLRSYVFGESNSLTVFERLYGDLNFDGVVDSTDYDLLYKYLVNYLVNGYEFSIFQKVSADVNVDGILNNEDLDIIGDFLDGYVLSLPNSTRNHLFFVEPPVGGISASLVYNAYYPGSFTKTAAAMPPHWSCPAVPNSPFSPTALAFDDQNRLYVGNDGYYGDGKERLLKQLYVFDNFLEKQTPDYYVRVPMGSVGDLSFDENNNLVIQDHTYPKVMVIDPLEKDEEDNFKWLYDLGNFEELQNIDVSCSQGQYNFYGKCIDTLEFFGQKRFGEISQDTVEGNTLYHSPGNIIDKSVSPNRLYVVDSGNNRILGFSGIGYCSESAQVSCTVNSDCPITNQCNIVRQNKADIIIGQEDEFGSSCNGDSNIGTFGKTSDKKLCLTDLPAGTNVAEQALRMNIDIDLEGNLYVMDVYNNRVLKYNSPLSMNKQDGRGDNVADFVIGQEDFYSNEINSGKGPFSRDGSTLYLSSAAHTWSIGLSVDNDGNIWVADSGNNRVLRFPKNSKIADLVIGQEDFYSNERYCNFPNTELGDYNSWDDNLPLNKFCKPTFASVNPETGDLYVIDDHDIYSRILVFRPEFKRGMSAYKVIKPEYPGTLSPLEANYPNYWFSASHIAFNCDKPGCDSNFFEGEYSSGKVWIGEVWPGFRILLLNENDEIIETIGARDKNEWGRGYGYWPSYVCGDVASNKGLSDPSGSFGFDEENNIYISDEKMFWVSRFGLPYETIFKKDWEGNSFECLPGSDAILLGQNKISGSKFKESIGTITYKDQLIVQDWDRLLVWDNYYSKEIGEEADFVIGQENMETRTKRTFDIGDASFFTIDDYDRLWMTNGLGNRITIFQLPLTKDSIPLVQNAELYWDDDKTPVGTSKSEVSGKWSRLSGIDFDETTKTMWVSNTNRILRIRSYDDPLSGKLYVDKVIGQVDKTNECNRGRSSPSANALCNAFQIKFDNYGNLFVIENDYECHINARITMFSAEDIAKL